MKNKIIFAFLFLIFFSFTQVQAQTPSKYFTETLQVGSTGDEVSSLQLLLKQFPDIYPKGLVTGYYGPITETAVKRFQVKQGIEADGIVGSETRNILNSMVLDGVPGFPETAATSSFTQAINAGTLTVDIVDGSYVTVASPAVAMGAATFGFSCQATTGTFGTASQQIYVKNPDAADNGWVVSLAASDPTDFWDSAGTDMDFNDPTTSGCGESGTDADSLKGQMTVDPSVGTLAAGQCAGCVTTNVTKGSSAAFNQDTAANSITILTGAAGSNDIGDWKLTGVGISQTIPAEQPAASDYSIDLTLSIVAS